jgi:hypothetical protein
MNVIFPSLLSLVFVAIGGVIIQYAVKMSGRARQSESWPSTEGEIAHSAVLYQTDTAPDRSIATYKADVAYRYEVKGASYTSSRISVVDFASTSNRAQQIAQRYPDKSRIQVYYNPSDPSESVLETGNTSGVNVLYLIGGVFAASGLFFMIMSLMGRVHVGS